MPIHCAVCGTPITRGSGRQRYCKPCSITVKNEDSKAWFSAHPGYHRQWYIKHRESELEKGKQRYNDDPDAAYAKIHKRRTRLNGNGGSYTPKELREQFTTQDYCCYYCHAPFFNGKLEIKFHVDHKVPVSQGGSSYISNIAIACPKCNLEKGTMTEDEFISSRIR